MTPSTTELATKLIHAGEPAERIHGAIVHPIFQSAMYECSGEISYHDIKYIRLGNTPSHILLNEKLAAIENAEAGLAFGSGMAAIATTLLALLEPGDHALFQDCLYGGTHDLVTGDLAAMGVDVDFIDGSASASWEGLLRPTTRLIYLETLSNPLLVMPDIEAGAAFAKAHGLVSLIDNTFPSPVNFRPAEWGIDLSLHSATKYLNGHSDIVAGAVVGRAELIDRVRLKLSHLGGALDPHACFLLERGMKTLALRMRAHDENGLAVARFLEASPRVTVVHYPGLESHSSHERACKLLDGMGGMISFELEGGLEAAQALLESTRLFASAPSLGGVESLITLPATTSHSGMDPADRARVGIGDALVRLSVGIEAADDLIADLEQALDRTA